VLEIFDTASLRQTLSKWSKVKQTSEEKYAE